MSMNVTEISLLWSKTLELIKTKISDKHLFDSFLSDSYIHQVEGKDIVVVVNSGLGITLLSSSKYSNLLKESVYEVSKIDYEIHLIAKEDLAKSKNTTQIINETPTYFQSSQIKTNLTFDLTINLKSGKIYQATIPLEIPSDEVIEVGTKGIEITEENKKVLDALEKVRWISSYSERNGMYYVYGKRMYT